MTKAGKVGLLTLARSEWCTGQPQHRASGGPLLRQRAQDTGCLCSEEIRLRGSPQALSVPAQFAKGTDM